MLSLIVLLVIAPAWADDEEDLKLQGDAAAVERVNLLLNHLGGAELWARSKHYFMEQWGWFTGPSEAAIEYSWRNFEAPGSRTHIVGRFTDTVFVLNEDEAWIKRKDDYTEVPQERHAEMKAGWLNGSYTMFHRLARRDQDLVLRFIEPQRVSIQDSDGEELSWYEINEYGHWLKWGTTDDEGNSVEYVYGPMKPLGNLSFPAWGAAVDGSWRYEYRQMLLSFEPIDPTLLQRPVSGYEANSDL